MYEFQTNFSLFRLLNLLEQYDNLENRMEKNTATQNEQQLEGFDYTEYREGIFNDIKDSHEKITKQIQEVIKSHIVPAILDYGKHKGELWIFESKFLKNFGFDLKLAKNAFSS